MSEKENFGLNEYLKKMAPKWQIWQKTQQIQETKQTSNNKSEQFYAKTCHN